LEKIDREANRAGQVMRRLREFFRGGGLRSENFTLAELINESLSYVKRRSERQGIQFKLALDDNLPSVMADRVQMGTVLHNLLSNAIEAIASSPEPREIEISAKRVDGDMIKVCVTDNGAGISSEMEGRLFESFATSKPEGMGLGLAISRTLVQAHGGELWLVGSQPTRFCFTLPISGPKP
jgi:signal transduction histidine kinase